MASDVESRNTNSTISSSSLHLKKLPENIRWKPYLDKLLQKVAANSSLKNLSPSVYSLSDDALIFLDSFLGYSLHRIVNEAIRLSMCYGSCSWVEVSCATRLLVSGETGIKVHTAALKAVTRYSATQKLGQPLSGSKSTICNLTFPVGQIQRWLIENDVSKRVENSAGIYLAAVLETIVEDLLGSTLNQLGNQGMTTNSQDCLSSDEVLVPRRDLSASYSPLHNLLQLGSGPRSSSRSISKEILQSSFLTWSCADDIHFREGLGAFVGALILPSQNQKDSKVMLPGGGNSCEDSLEPKEKDRTLSFKTIQNLEMSSSSSDVEGVFSVLRPTASVHQHYNPRSIKAKVELIAPNVSCDSHQAEFTWTPQALQTLHYFVDFAEQGERRLAAGVSDSLSASFITYPQLNVLESLIRGSLIFADHRARHVVDHGDVAEAARILGLAECPLRWHTFNIAMFATPDPTHTIMSPDAMLLDGFFRVVCSGRIDLVPSISAGLHALGYGINTANCMGFTLLMCATALGDLAMVRALLKVEADPNISVSSVDSPFHGYTALHFSVLYRDPKITKLLLQHGAHPEGNPHLRSSRIVSPLHLACGAETEDLVLELLAAGADPYRTHEVENERPLNAFARAAAAGKRDILKNLIEHAGSSLSTTNSQLLSLQEILAEGFHRSPGASQRAPPPSTSSHFTAPSSMPAGKTLAPRNIRHAELSEALFLAAEHGFLEVCVDLRRAGVRWNLHSWVCTFIMAHAASSDDVIRLLLSDYLTHRYEDMTIDFCEEGLPLLFTLMMGAKSSEIRENCANVLGVLWGPSPGSSSSSSSSNNQGLSSLRAASPVPPLLVPSPPPPSVGASMGAFSRFVNRAELSDVQFIVEGQPVYAHKIILVNASEKFKILLMHGFAESSQREIVISDVSYDVFIQVMEFLYAGTTAFKIPSKEVNYLLGVMDAADFFLLDGLKHVCEESLTPLLNLANAVPIYQRAVQAHSQELEAACDVFFLTHLGTLYQTDAFRDLLEREDSALCGRLHGMLSRRLAKRVRLCPGLRV